MGDSIKYENGILTIPYKEAIKYLGNIADIRDYLRGTQENLDISSFMFAKGEDYIPFRILDGEFLPYINTCIGGNEGCTSYEKNSYLAKTMVGTIVVEKNINLNAIEAEYHRSREYKINSISGVRSKKVDKEIGGFPKIFWESIKNGKDVEFRVSEEVFKLISITSESWGKVDTAPIKIIIPDTELINIMDSLQRKEIITTKYVNPNSVIVTYELTKEEHICINSVAKNKLKSDKLESVKNKESLDKTCDAEFNSSAATKNNLDKSYDTGLEIELDSNSIKEVVEYLSKPASLSYQINPNLDSKFSLNITFPNDFKSILVQHLNIKRKELSTQDSLEIMIDREDCPAVSEHIKEVFHSLADKILEGDDQAGIHEVMAGCSIYLELAGYVN